MQASDPGEICWNEYLATDPGPAAVFYSKLFGWKAEGMTGPGSGYTILRNGDEPVAGLAQTPAPGIPSHWLTYIRVADCDATARHATTLGGKILVPPTDILPGKMAIIADPQGAVVGLFTPHR